VHSFAEWEVGDVYEVCRGRGSKPGDQVVPIIRGSKCFAKTDEPVAEAGRCKNWGARNDADNEGKESDCKLRGIYTRQTVPDGLVYSPPTDPGQQRLMLPTASDVSHSHRTGDGFVIVTTH